MRVFGTVASFLEAERVHLSALMFGALSTCRDALQRVVPCCSVSFLYVAVLRFGALTSCMVKQTLSDRVPRLRSFASSVSR
jgi:hypothetical protein